MFLDDEFRHFPSDRWPNVSAADLRWFERYWLNVHSHDGRYALGQGIGVYPNLGTMDAFALLVDSNIQYNLRAAVRPGCSGSDLRVGPVRAEIKSGGRKWLFASNSGAADFSYEIEFDSDLQPAPHTLPHGEPETVNSLPIRWCTFAQTGRPRGVIRLGSRKIDVRPDSWWAGRDRSWGVRPGIGGGGELEWLGAFQKLHWGFLLYWVLFSTPNRQFWYFGTHDPGGGNRHFTGFITEKDGRVTPIIDVEHDVILDPESARFQKAHLRIHTSSHIEEITVTPFSTVYLRGGLYDGLNGVYHGTDRGPSVVEGESWNSRLDPQLRQSVTGLNDHASRFEGKDGAGRGVFELHYGT